MIRKILPIPAALQNAGVITCLLALSCNPGKDLSSPSTDTTATTDTSNTTVTANTTAVNDTMAATSSTDTSPATSSPTTDTSSTSGASSTTSTGATTSVAKFCEDAHSESECSQGEAPEGLSCAWLSVYSMITMQGECWVQDSYFRCLTVDWGGGDNACVVQYDGAVDDFYSPALESQCALIASPGWLSCWDEPKEPFCTCLSGM